MKKQKVIILNSEEQNKQDFDAIHELHEGLNKIDQFPVYTPNLQWFEQMVVEEQQHTRRKLIRDLSVFFIVAFIIISGMLVSLYQMPTIFVIVQIITTIFIASYTSVRLIKKATRNE
ncbi:YxlC family protein [Neobacillus soli]|uniref:YxlC family protein n=1 Tax=Neobacillus soli TaxID=220688 RepID=UPI0008254D57|nr:YxlC family protein [Neobacillus soli]